MQAGELQEMGTGNQLVCEAVGWTSWGASSQSLHEPEAPVYKRWETHRVTGVPLLQQNRDMGMIRQIRLFITRFFHTSPSAS